MTINLATVALAAAALLFPGDALRAQSSFIGFDGAEISASALSGNGTSIARLDGNADFAITAHHGLQLDLGIIDYGETWFGSIGGHLYMQPVTRAKYGLFFGWADANDREAATVELGVEGLWSLGESLTLGARAGLGRADPSEVDYIFAGVTADHSLSDRLALSAGAHLLDADEAAASQTAVTLDLGLRYSFAEAPVELHLGASHARISGSTTERETRLSLGLTAWFGKPRSARRPVSQRTFAPVRPLEGLLSRNMVWDGIARR